MNLFGDPSGPEITHFTFTKRTERDRDLYHFMNDRRLCKFCSKFFSAFWEPRFCVDLLIYTQITLAFSLLPLSIPFQE